MLVIMEESKNFFFVQDTMSLLLSIPLLAHLRANMILCKVVLTVRSRFIYRARARL